MLIFIAADALMLSSFLTPVKETRVSWLIGHIRIEWFIVCACPAFMFESLLLPMVVARIQAHGIHFNCWYSFKMVLAFILFLFYYLFFTWVETRGHVKKGSNNCMLLQKQKSKQRGWSHCFIPSLYTAHALSVAKGRTSVRKPTSLSSVTLEWSIQNGAKEAIPRISDERNFIDLESI